VLGIDNIVFISILAGKLKTQAERDQARRLGILVALISRIVLVLSVAWIVTLTQPVFRIDIPGLTEDGQIVSWKDIILFTGGAFLIWKAVKEIHNKLEGEETSHGNIVAPTLGAILGQILILDLVFSIDSVITAVGMVSQVSIMIIAVLIAVVFMLLFSKAITDFVQRHPTVKMLALAFLILIGVSLIAESFDQAIPKGYIYFSMAFAVLVEYLNLRTRGSAPVKLKENLPG